MGARGTTEFVRHNIVDILSRRHNGDSCRVIAEDLGVPEHQIWYVMKQTGYAGKLRARMPPRTAPVRPEIRRSAVTGSVTGSVTGTTGRPAPSEQMSITAILGYLEHVADIVEIERSADETGWIVTIDEITGGQCRSMEHAIHTAFEVFQKWEGGDLI